MKLARKPLLCSLTLLVLIILIEVLALNENGVLQFYSRGLYPLISQVQRLITGIFTFPIGDVLYAILIAFALWKSIKFIIQRKSKQKSDWLNLPFYVINFFLILYIAFKLLWGLNYERPRIATELNLPQEKFNDTNLVDLTSFFINRINKLDSQVRFTKPITFKYVKDESIVAYKKMSQKHSFFTYKNPSFKPVWNAWVISNMGIEGYYNPLSGEANLNTNLPSWVQPFVACHEIAHQLGVAREDEANLIGYLTALNSDEIAFQYSANYNMLRYLLYQVSVNVPDQYEGIYKTISPSVIAKFKAESAFWKQYNSQMSNYMSIAFDRFLKFNKQKTGIKSYQNIVIWLWNVHRHQVLARSSTSTH